jgi:hypothetical protein
MAWLVIDERAAKLAVIAVFGFNPVVTAIVVGVLEARR